MARTTKRADDRYCVRLTYEDSNVVPQRRAFYGRTQAEVRKAAQEGREALEKGAPVRDSSRTSSAWLGEWQREHLDRGATSTVEATTRASHVSARPPSLRRGTGDAAPMPMPMLRVSTQQVGQVPTPLSARTARCLERVQILDSAREPTPRAGHLGYMNNT